MSKLRDNCNKEIFLVYNDEKNDENIPLEICIISEFTKLLDHLKELTPSIDSGTRILHGILTKAFNLPKNLRGKTAFIIVNSSNSNQAMVIETDANSDKDLSSVIISILSYNRLNFVGSLEIEDVYILYGYEISTMLSLDEEEVDEETINTCQKIVNDAKIIEDINKNEDFFNE